MKKCSKCGVVKPLSDFHKHSTRGHQWACKPCARKAAKAWIATHPEHVKERNHEYNLKNRDRLKGQKRNRLLRYKYGISQNIYEALYASQGGRCAICHGIFALLYVDHDHDTGQVRALLCNSCNRGIGYLGDNGDRLERAALYVKKFRMIHNLQVA